MNSIIISRVEREVQILPHRNLLIGMIKKCGSGFCRIVIPEAHHVPFNYKPNRCLHDICELSFRNSLRESEPVKARMSGLLIGESIGDQIELAKRCSHEGEPKGQSWRVFDDWVCCRGGNIVRLKSQWNSD